MAVEAYHLSSTKGSRWSHYLKLNEAVPIEAVSTNGERHMNDFTIVRKLCKNTRNVLI